MNADQPRFAQLTPVLLAALLFARPASGQTQSEPSLPTHPRPQWVQPAVDWLAAVANYPADPDGTDPALRSLGCDTPFVVTRPIGEVEAMQLALCQTPRLRAAWASVVAQRAGLGQARASYYPTVSLVVSSVENRTAYTSYNSVSRSQGQMLSTTMSARLFDFGGRQANLADATHQLTASQAAHEGAVARAIQGALESYTAVQSASSALRAKLETEAVNNLTFQAAKRREAGGAGARGDVVQANAALAKASIERNRAATELKKARAVLIYALGLPADTEISVADPPQPRWGAAARSVQDWLKIAADNHPAIRSAQAQWESAKAKVAVAKSEGKPTVDVTLSHHLNGTPSQGVTKTNITNLAVSLNVPLFSGFDSIYKRQAAEALSVQREQELADTRQNVLMEVVRAEADVTSAAESVADAERLFSLATQALDSSRRKYENGAADLVEVLGAQIALSDARDALERGVWEIRAAQIRLYASSGTLRYDMQR